ncbi:hypothetical protein QTP70_019325 [Hemibagrus guttatus]|uniref:Cystatin domain-containing protein n=1 Tax=Hemibagrus guttatus TaxID=175788 RepID=A0AAE0QW19_9TELE|nr:hypothetical protein QTP70_019325 [Hemibagrus guttatus]KAK3561990.1 hypothetical protein QTP86_023342 [Hemibagrus guttatus]
MQGHRIWVFLALSWLFCSGSHADDETKLQCDDSNVQDAVASVLSAHNKGLTEGNQLALYQILEAAKAQNESGKVLSLHFTARESNCTAGGDTNWQECDYLHDSSKVLTLLRHCRARLLLKETNEILSHYCSAGFRYRLQFDMQKSNCSKEDFKDITEECHLDRTEEAFINCNSTVDVAPWRHELPNIFIKCEPGQLDEKLIARRRPPGWSPLRNIHDFEVKPKKKDSSEESQESKILSVAPSESQNPTTEPSQSVVLTSGNGTTFNCPSKPWKVFDVRANPPPPPRPRPENNVHELDLEAALNH